MMTTRNSGADFIAVHPHGIEEYLRNPGRGTLYAVRDEAGSASSRRQKIVASAKSAGLEVVSLSKHEFERKARDLGISVEGRKLFLVGEPPSGRGEPASRSKPSGAAGKGPDPRGATKGTAFNSKLPRSFDEYLASIQEGRAARPRILLALQEVTDPQNLGAVIRVADQFQADAVLITKRRSASVTSAVSTASVGADRYVPVLEVTNIVRSLEQLKDLGFWVYGADLDGQHCSAAKLDGDLVIVLGSEGSGLGRLVRETCDGLLFIPTGGIVDSLNVSVASGILAYEVRRQQGFAYEQR